MNNRNITVGGNVTNSTLSTGNNAFIQQFNQTSLQAEDVNIQQEVAGLREILSQLQTPDQGKIDRALTDAEEETAKSEPDKSEVEKSIERAMNHAKKADGYVEVMEKLAVRLMPIAVWLGLNADKFSHLISSF